MIVIVSIWISKYTVIIACCLILKQKYRHRTSKLDALYFFRCPNDILFEKETEIAVNR